MNEEQVAHLKKIFTKLFALPIGKLTIREVQNTLHTVLPDDFQKAAHVFESLITGEVVSALQGKTPDTFQQLVQQFSPAIALAKEVHEYGEFINICTSDLVSQGNQPYFVNRYRRVDGVEFHFFTLPDTSVRLAHMLVNRLHDLKKAYSPHFAFDPHLLVELKNMRQDIDKLLNDHESK